MRKAFLTRRDRAALRELKTKVEEFLGDQLQRIVLFGSKARGDAEADSDLDIAILVRKLTKKRKDQMLNLIADIEIKHLVVISALVLSIENFNRLKSRELRIALDIESEGIPL